MSYHLARIQYIVINLFDRDQWVKSVVKTGLFRFLSESDIDI